MAEDTVQELKSKLESQATEFENYKAQCKQLQQFLQEESKKKEDQIRKLKEQAIKKEKGFASSKTQITALQTENAALKAELTSLKEQQSANQNSANQAEAHQKQIDEINKKNTELGLQAESLKKQKAKLEDTIKSMKREFEDEKSKLQKTLADKMKEELAKKPSVKEPKPEVKKEKDSGEEDKLKQKIAKLEKKINDSAFDVQKAQEKALKLSKQVQSLQNKLSSSDHEKETLLKKVKELSGTISSQKQIREDNQCQIEEEKLSPSKIGTGQNLNSGSLIVSGLVLTKKHYASPFMELKNNNQIKMFKSTKNGCFQKSLGTLKYKLNHIGFESEQIIKNCAQNLNSNILNGIKSSVFFYGPKKTSKKYLLANLLTKIKDLILERIGESSEEPEVLFIKASPDPDKRVQLSGTNKEQIEKIIDEIISMAQKSPRKTQIKKKTVSKPKARYFRFTQGEDFIEIITTSFTNITFREGLTFSEAFNNIGYSRLPNALQPVECHRQVILTLNPIVSLYDDCRNMLSLLTCKKATGAETVNDGEWREISSPNKEELNDLTKKKLENIERQTEQNSLKMRKQEDEISFYKGKFDELEVRLKTLLNTHQSQNTYLKKSPITLSYEKMLKFVHSVQSKSGSSHSISLAGSKVYEDYNQGEENEYAEAQGQDEEIVEEGDKSVEEVL